MTRSSDQQILVEEQFNQSVTADSDILTDFEPSETPTIIRVQAAFDTAGVLSVMRTQGGTTVKEELSDGNNLPADTLQAFEFVASEPDDAINLQYSATATLLSLKVTEVIVE